MCIRISKIKDDVWNWASDKKSYKSFYYCFSSVIMQHMITDEKRKSTWKKRENVRGLPILIL